MTTLPDDWVALLPCRLADQEKRTLEAVAQLGAVSIASDDDLDPDEGPGAIVLVLEERGLVECAQHGETFTRNGRSRRDGVDVYRLTELGKLWLQSCRRAEEKAVAGVVQSAQTPQPNGAFSCEEGTR